MRAFEYARCRSSAASPEIARDACRAPPSASARSPLPRDRETRDAGGVDVGERRVLRAARIAAVEGPVLFRGAIRLRRLTPDGADGRHRGDGDDGTRGEYGGKNRFEHGSSARIIICRASLSGRNSCESRPCFRRAAVGAAGAIGQGQTSATPRPHRRRTERCRAMRRSSPGQKSPRSETSGAAPPYNLGQLTVARDDRRTRMSAALTRRPLRRESQSPSQEILQRRERLRHADGRRTTIQSPGPGQRRQAARGDAWRHLPGPRILLDPSGQRTRDAGRDPPATRQAETDGADVVKICVREHPATAASR